jgi:hypothetical protein
VQSSALGAQFCLELAFGLYLALAWVALAPLGAFFFRMMGTAALVAALAALALAFSGTSEVPRASLWALGASAALFPLYSGPIRARSRRAALAAAAVAAGTALAVHVQALPGIDGWRSIIAVTTALSTGAVAGSVGLAMVFGHWYLTVPELDLAFLGRLNRLTVGCMALCLVAVAASCIAFAAGERAGLIGPRGLFHVGTRVAVGLVAPIAFAWMVGQSLEHRNTRSATGILYASTVLVLIGTAVSISLQDTYGIPL